MSEYSLSEYSLYATGALPERAYRWHGFSLEEVDYRTLLSVAARRNCESQTREIIRERFNATLPGPQQSTLNANMRIMWTAQEQWFVSAPNSDSLVDEFTQCLRGVASVTEQSDGWVELALSGTKTREVLELLSPVDLRAQTFGPNATTRTTIEHIGVQLTQIDTNAPAFSLLSFRSSGRSLLHAVQEAATTICGKQLN